MRAYHRLENNILVKVVGQEAFEKAGPARISFANGSFYVLVNYEIFCEIKETLGNTGKTVACAACIAGLSLSLCFTAFVT